MSNEKQMTLEEKLVQHIKDDKLIMLLGDEDAITELTKRAVTAALFADRKDPNDRSIYNSRMIPSPAVEAAKDVADKLAKAAVDAIVSDDEIRKKFREAVADALPAAIANHLSGAISSLMSASSANSMAMLRDAVRNNTL